MKMMLRSLLVLTLILAPGAGYAAPDDPEHQQATREMLRAMRIIDMTRVGFRKVVADKMELKEIIMYADKHVSDEELLDVYVPVYARHVSTAEARKASAAFRNKDTQLALDMAVRQIRNGPAVSTRMTPAQRIALETFNRSPWGKWFVDLAGRVSQDSARALQVWMADYHTALFMSGLRGVAQHTQAYAATDRKTAPTAYFPDIVGVSYIDATNLLVAESTAAILKAEWQLDTDLDVLGIEKLLDAATLSSPQKVVAARLTLEQIDAKVEAYIANSDLGLKKTIADLRMIEMPAKDVFHRGLQIGFERRLDWSVRFAENQRAILDVIRRILVFADARKNKISLQDGKMLFETDADVALFKALVAEAQSEDAKGERLRAEAMQRVMDIANGK